MASAYFGVGAAQGILQGLDDNRRKGLEDEDRKLRLEDRAENRQRQRTLDDRNEEAYKYGVSQRPVEEKARALTIEGQGEQVKQLRRLGEYQEKDRPAAVERQKIADETSRVQLGNAKKQGAAYDKKLADATRQANEEGFGDFLDALEKGADVNYAVKLYNSKGKAGIVPGSVKYDAQTGNFELEHFDGKKRERVKSNVKTMKLALQPNGGAPIKIKNDDRLVDPRTYKDVLPPGGGQRPAGNFNEQTFVRDAQNGFAQLTGARYDNIREQFQFDDKLKDQGVLGTAFVGQIAKMLKEQGVVLGQGVQPGEIAAIAADAVRGIKGAAAIEGELSADPAFKTATPEQRNAEIAKRVQQSKLGAALAVRKGVENIVAKRGALDQQQEADASFPADPETSEDIADPQIQQGSPDPKYLQEGYTRTFKDGSTWTLENGVPKRLE